ncbi:MULTISPECIES: NADPH-dependent F420 reductase [unclassified Variovorax]|uniref:NADPH-dependent F420 reductase n=1 Tax=unclassified Variovorax TaxID=663243 RepID=UPI003F45763A
MLIHWTSSTVRRSHEGTEMKIGIIGTGNIGGALARRFRASGHDVAIANSRGPASLQELARETGARPVTIDEVVQGAELVMVAIPMMKVASLPAHLFADASPGLIVVDTSNYYPRERDGRIAEIEAGLTESGWVQQRLGHRVVKAFNSIVAQHLLENGRPAGSPDRIALAVSGDDVGQKSVVARLLDDIGFDAVDAGTIAQSWRQQPGTPGYLQDLGVEGVRAALQQARPERAAQWTATDASPGTYDAPR